VPAITRIENSDSGAIAGIGEKQILSIVVQYHAQKRRDYAILLITVAVLLLVISAYMLFASMKKPGYCK